MSTAPRASVIIPAFNLARYLPAAIDSALAQDPHGGPIEVIVIDDGSTDETPQVLDAYRDRVKVVRQANRGFVATVDRGLGLANGEYIALLDADDEWPRDRLRRHIEVLDARPLAGLVQGDMEMIDSAGHTTHPSFFALKGIQPTDGRVLGRLLGNNFVSGGASTFRASLLPAIHPMAEEAAYPDWWIAACVAAVAEIVHDGATSNRYRSHGANMGLNASPGKAAEIYRYELTWRRWMMWNLIDDDTVSPGDMQAALQAWNMGLGTAAAGAGVRTRELLEVDPDAARDVLASAPAGSLPDSRALMRAFSRDPFDGALGVDLAVALHREAHQALPAPSAPLIAFQARPRLTLAWLDELTARPELVRAYAEEAGGDEDATLGVLFPHGADLSSLVALVESDELASREGCDITALPEPVTPPARALIAARACAWLGERPTTPPYSDLRVHGAVERAEFALGR
ncbi:MAG TPA: glycosyltransferase [Solirubrobacteraceae bacterium]|nr:glycosyltransferase [Solirubrobacteraceae bacterium]